MQIHTVGVIGCGLMGSGIAEVCARSGFAVLVREVNQELLDKGLARVDRSLDSAVERGKLSPEERAATRARLQGTLGLDAFAGCDLVIEAATENLNIKRQTFGDLDRVCPAHTILTSNTSSIPIIHLATATQRPDRVMGTHFFNPVPAMRLLELVRALTTSDETLATVRAFGEDVGKRPIVSQDRAGFIVNYLLTPYLLDAIRMVEQEFASREDVDLGMLLGTSLPMGPLSLMDFIGLDTILSATEVFFDAFKEPRFAAPALLRQMVASGWLGRKTGRGFYNYRAGEQPPSAR